MKNNSILACMIFISFLLQCTVLKFISVGSISPNLLLILCISMGLMRGRKCGIWVGLFCGLLMDLSYSPVFGVHAALYMILGYISGHCYKIYYDNKIKVPLVLVTAGDLLYNFLFYIILFLLRGRTDFLFYLRRIMIPEMIYTVLLTVVVYRILYKINHRFMRTTIKERDSLWLIK